VQQASGLLHLEERMGAVVVYVGQGCHLCDAALEVVRDVCGDAFAIVDITGDPGLERKYRERIPVVEIDGATAFTYFVHRDALRTAIGA
jgi:hypothetical protein